MAAGIGRRFGANKLLADLRGKPVFKHVFDALPRDVFERVVVVSGTAAVLEEARKRGFETAINSRPEEGPRRTIQLGLRHLLDLDACMFCVCDQPELQPQSLRRLAVQDSESIRALSFRGQRGNPVIFPRSLYNELLQLPIGRGGAAVIRKHPGMLILSESGCAREMLDVDTAHTMARVQELRHVLISGQDAAGKLRQAAELRGADPNTILLTMPPDIPPEGTACVLDKIDTSWAQDLLTRDNTILLSSDDLSIPAIAARLDWLEQTGIPPVSKLDRRRINNLGRIFVSGKD